MNIPNAPKANLWLVFWLAFLLNFVAQAAHEFGHLAVYQLGGHEPTWGFTRLVQTDIMPRQPAQWVSITYLDGTPGWERVKSLPGSRLEKVIAAAGGPLMSLLTAALGLMLAFRSRQPCLQWLGLVLVLTVSFVAGAYYLRSPMRTGGDEAEIATLLGISKAVLDIPLGLAFGVCLALGLRQLPTWRIRLQWLGLIILASVGGGLPLGQVDSMVTSQVDLGNPLFRTVLGYSLPVLIFNGLVCLALLFTIIKLDTLTHDTQTHDGHP